MFNICTNRTPLATHQLLSNVKFVLSFEKFSFSLSRSKHLLKSLRHLEWMFHAPFVRYTFSKQIRLADFCSYFYSMMFDLHISESTNPEIHYLYCYYYYYYYLTHNICLVYIQIHYRYTDYHLSVWIIMFDSLP